MRVLLDTHTLLWATLSPHSLSSQAKEIIADEANSILVSAASAWEIATKVRAGKLPGAEALERDFSEVIARAGYIPLSIEVDHALRAGRLPGAHRDPFGRMLASQALALDVPILSSDTKLNSFGVRRIW